MDEIPKLTCFIQDSFFGVVDFQLLCRGFERDSVIRFPPGS